MSRAAAQAVTSSRPLAGRAGRRRAGWLARPGVITVACYVLGALYVTSRLLPAPGARLQNGDTADVDQATWFLRYAAAAVAHFHLPALVATTMNAPHGVNLMWNTSLLLPGVVLSPVTLAFGPQAALTAMLGIGFAGSAAALYFVLRRWQVSPLAAALGGALYGFSPALINSGIGHYPLVAAMLPPLLADRALRLAAGRGRPVTNGAWLGVLVAAQLFISEEILLATVLAVVALLVVLALSRPREVAARLRPAAAGLGVAAVAALVLGARGLWVQFHGVAAKGAAATTTISHNGKLTTLGTLPQAFVNPTQYVLAHTAATSHVVAAYPQPTEEYLAYLGIPLIIVLAAAIVYFWRELPVRVAGLAFLALEWLGMGGTPLQHARTLPGFLLPWNLLEHLPVISGMVPDRLAILADGCAAAVLAFGLDAARSGRYPAFARWPRAGGRVAAAIGVIALLPLVPAPYMPVAAATVPAGYTATFAALHLPPDARVLLAPYPYSGTTPVLRWQAVTGEPSVMIGGDFIAPDQPGRQARAGRAGMTPTSYYIDYLATGKFPVPRPSASQARADLAAWDPAAVVAVTAPASRLGRYLTQLLGPPGTRIGAVLSWRLTPTRH